MAIKISKSRLLALDVAVVVLLILALAIGFSIYTASEKDIDRENNRRLLSNQLAAELRQSSDDLTRMVRTYVATGNPVYLQYFDDILAIRDGKLPRPDNYDQIYWDYITAGQTPPAAPGTKVALLTSMRNAGFTEWEFNYLASAKTASDALTQIELQAITLVKEGQGDLQDRRAKAIELVFGEEYHRAKLNIMANINATYRSMQNRTNLAVQSAENRALYLRGVVIALGLLLFFALWRTFYDMRTWHGGSIPQIYHAIEQLGNAARHQPVPLEGLRPESLMLWLSVAQNSLIQSRKRWEQLNAELESRVAERTEELNAARHYAEITAAAKGKFLANMSHEIRTPMNAIIGLSALALKEETSAMVRGYLTQIKNSGDYLLNIVNDVLDISKIESGKLEIEAIPFELSSVLENAMTITSPKAHGKGLRFQYDVAPDIPPQLVGDPLRIGQILINLLNNAIKFTEHGSVLLTIRPHGSGGDATTLMFQVRDTGIGLSPEQQSKLFQSFSQSDNSTSRKYGGTGLGLSISKSLVEAMGGQIGVQSALGEGSTFWFTLVLAPHTSALEGSNTPASPASETVLVLDHDPVAAAALASIAAGLGFQVDTVDSGEAALTHIVLGDVGNNPYTLLLLDPSQTPPGGLNVLHTLDQLQLQTRPTVVFMGETGASHGTGTHTLTKPVEAAQLVELCKNVRTAAATAAPVPVTPAVLPASPQAPGTAAPHALQGLAILLAEDNKINQLIAMENLKLWGCVVDVADNGVQAVDMVRTRLASERPYDLVLMDMQMPEMDGLEATRHIRKTCDAAALPIIAMTANTLQTDRDECLSAGMNGFVSKPIRPNVLQNTLTIHLAVKSSRLAA